MSYTKQIIGFTSDAGALEKLLRFIQFSAQILASYTSERAAWLLLRSQLALGRRYFRWFRFLDCFSKAYESFNSTEARGTGFMGALLVGKWGFMGAYLGLESLAILDVMGVWPAHEWGQFCLLEGSRLWFYALVCSIIWQLCVLYLPSKAGNASSTGTEAKSKGSHGKANSKEKDSTAKLRAAESRMRTLTKRRLAADAFDLFLPGAVTGWIPAAPETVGFAGVASTTLGLMEMWDKF
ncbi:uncharacterized protein BP5553_03996 [Venustampulla echinocandica]|uniref:Peroxisomal biogenesis factor 11 n=1 Tax=Venustampulla echinocandica TaxID=2656787 RepID=A0A370TVV4_9HELO|nr:uncharacterized protein BP5553_03996 [Venustampulla echinocandica]RDL39656.1 hypothetical protein BP5553_03996 [Venustampulla echinocandica]